MNQDSLKQPAGQPIQLRKHGMLCRHAEESQGHATECFSERSRLGNLVNFFGAMYFSAIGREFGWYTIPLDQPMEAFLAAAS